MAQPLIPVAAAPPEATAAAVATNPAVAADPALAAVAIAPPARRPRRPRFPSARQRAPLILERLGVIYPHATCSLDWRTPWELLVATMLSAQCTDERVNQVTPALFGRFPDAAAAAAAEPAEVEPFVHSTGFFRNKAKNIVGASRLLMERHGGAVPASMEELLELPGVARKTANVVLAHAFGINAGVTVDTHVRRLANRLHLSRRAEPRQIEPELMKLVPRAEWENLSIRLIFHGRAVCSARKPRCQGCPIGDLCPSHPDR